MSTPPDITDPVVVVANDGMLFACWVEPLGDLQRWIFISRDQDRYIGPVYQGEASLGQIKALVNEWWDMKGRLGHENITPEKMRRWITKG
jgi:hypothetical protein